MPRDGFYDSDTDQYELKADFKLPFIECSDEPGPGDDDSSSVSAVMENACRQGACEEDVDSQQCLKVARPTREYFVRLTRQNFGNGGTPNCCDVLVSLMEMIGCSELTRRKSEIESRCTSRGGAGGTWSVQDDGGDSQEFCAIQRIFTDHGDGSEQRDINVDIDGNVKKPQV